MNVKLPESSSYNPISITNFYGANYISSEYINIRKSKDLIYRYWQHAWVNNNWRHHPDFIATEPIDNKDNLILVSRVDEERFLIGLGYKSKAIGLPYCYTSELEYSREENSLLVMPAHSTRDLSIDLTDEYNKFIAYIINQREFFSNIIICVHQEDIDNNYHKKWVDNGFEVVRGASINDKNTLNRMKALFLQFSTILTDAMGSHVVYAASSGAKISMQHPVGWKYDISKNQYLNEDKSRIPNGDTLLGRDTWIDEFEFLFCDPIDAHTHVEWGLEQIGYENKLSPNELKRILGWNFPVRQLELIAYNYNRIMNKMKRLAGLL